MTTRRFVTILSALALVATNVVAGAASPALAAPQTATTWSLTARTTNSGQSATLPAGATGVNELRITVQAEPGRTIWGAMKKGKWTFTASTDLTIDAGDFYDFGYSAALLGTSSTDPDCFAMNWLNPSVLSVPKKSCVDTISIETVADFWDAVPETSTTFATNLNSVGIKVNGRLIDSAAIAERNLVLSYSVADADHVTVNGSAVEGVGITAPVCVDENLVAAGDSVRVALAATANAATVSETQSDSSPWLEWTGSMYSGGSNSEDIDIHSLSWWEEGVESSPLEKVIDGFYGTVHLPNAGEFTIAASADLLDGGDSVLESCPTTGDVWPSALDTSASNGTMNATSTTTSLPDNMVWQPGSTASQIFVADGFGGFFTAANPNPQDDTEMPRLAVAHFDADGPSNGFGTTGSVSVPANDAYDTVLSRYGTGGTKWASYDGVDWESMENTFTVGDFAGAAPLTVGIPINDVNAACNPAKKTGDTLIDTLSTPTAMPLSLLYCGYKLGKKGWTNFPALAAITTSGGGSIAQVTGLMPNPTKPTAITAHFVATDPTATGSDFAVWSYVEAFSGTGKSKKTSRTVTTVTADGTVEQTLLTTNPFPGGTPDSLNLIPGPNNGDWHGVTSKYVDGAPVAQLVTVNASTTIAVKSAPSGLASYGAEVTPVGTSSDGRLTVGVWEWSEFDNVTTFTRKTGVLNAAMTTIDWGESVSTDTYCDYLFNWLYRPMWGADGSGNVTSYWVTSPTEYQVVTWDLP